MYNEMQVLVSEQAGTIIPAYISNVDAITAKLKGLEPNPLGGMMGSVAMRIIFALMDPDGDGTVSLEAFQAAHERIFKAMDGDKDGTLTPDEIHDFFRGSGKSAPQY